MLLLIFNLYILLSVVDVSVVTGIVVESLSLFLNELGIDFFVIGGIYINTSEGGVL